MAITEKKVIDNDYRLYIELNRDIPANSINIT